MLSRPDSFRHFLPSSLLPTEANASYVTWPDSETHTPLAFVCSNCKTFKQFFQGF